MVVILFWVFMLKYVEKNFDQSFCLVFEEMRICYDLRIQYGKPCENNRSFRVVNGFNSKMLDIFDKMRKYLIDIVEDKIAFPSDNGCLMFQQSSYLRQNSLNKLFCEKISQHCEGCHDDKGIL